MTLMVDPVPSVCLAQKCTILINACVVQDFGIPPNWLSPIFLRIDGRKYSATTNSSATLERLEQENNWGFCHSLHDPGQWSTSYHKLFLIGGLCLLLVK